MFIFTSCLFSEYHLLDIYIICIVVKSSVIKYMYVRQGQKKNYFAKIQYYSDFHVKQYFVFKKKIEYKIVCGKLKLSKEQNVIGMKIRKRTFCHISICRGILGTQSGRISLIPLCLRTRYTVLQNRNANIFIHYLIGKVFLTLQLEIMLKVPCHKIVLAPKYKLNCLDHEFHHGGVQDTCCSTQHKPFISKS